MSFSSCIKGSTVKQAAKEFHQISEAWWPSGRQHWHAQTNSHTHTHTAPEDPSHLRNSPALHSSLPRHGPRLYLYICLSIHFFIQQALMTLYLVGLFYFCCEFFDTFVTWKSQKILILYLLLWSDTVVEMTFEIIFFIINPFSLLYSLIKSGITPDIWNKKNIFEFSWQLNKMLH